MRVPLQINYAQPKQNTSFASFRTDRLLMQ